ncbi:MraY family glycosyltransferase [Pseudomonas citronellolis]|uniref:MraY family glycosyltransferase n=1 Tax=Pseudomonas citronellolis TaxID=53408 RepID=UPI0023E431A6|nr:glycosyltransferase family 4 protein [Pseudomonas citronellolis]MDF3934145.1 glycosyltransferase family 4 protein [Pseudomonas citronellolis]
MTVVLLLLAVLLAWAGTASVRRYALARSVMDVPNERSSHSVPTPRGGGVAIVLSFLLVLLLAWWLGLADTREMLSLVLPGALIALVGFVDDHRPVPARWRLLGHFLGAALLLYVLGGLPALPVAGANWDLGVVGWLAALFYLVWLLNLYNFMDGIDGIASLEAITVCVGGALCYWFVGAGAQAGLPLLLAAAALGFLLWNFPPARIFMGDAGSGFLGLVLGGLSLQAAWTAPQLFWAWLILLGVFVVDATWTLARRLLRGERVYLAHRSHAYQRASRRLGQHRAVSLAVVAVNLAWLLPIAVLVTLGWIDGVLGLIVAYAPLVLVVAILGAGAPE